MHYLEHSVTARKFVNYVTENVAACTTREGYKPKPCVGGLMICADLGQAFEGVPRGRLKEAMEDAGFTSDEIAVFMS